MAIKEKINKYLQKLPENSQEEVLDFVEFLLNKSKQDSFHREKRKWSNMSLTFAMRGMEDEKTPEYSLDDLKERFLSV